MKTYINQNTNIFFSLLSIAAMLLLSACERDEGDLVPATFTNNPDVYIDGFSSGLEYYPYADSKVDAFDVDAETKYKGTSSMRFDVPNASEGYAGAIFRDDNGGRNLTGYNVLTFWAKASVSNTINQMGFGQDFFGNEYEVSITNVALTTNWKKYYIPIPDPSKLTQSQGMIWYSTASESGFTFWLDEVKYENLGTVAHVQPVLYDGVDDTVAAFNGVKVGVNNIGVLASLPNGEDLRIGAAVSYFDFSTSNAAVASIDATGVATVLDSGQTTISASIGGVPALGSLTIKSDGDFNFAPAPAQDASNVVSLFSNAYSNVPVDWFNGYWEPWQTTIDANFGINGDSIIRYTNFNFVGNQFSNPTVDASAFTHFHIDIFIPGDLDPGAQLQITLRDFGANGADGGGDDSNQTLVLNSSTLKGNDWASVDIPLTIASRSRMGLIIYENLNTNLTEFYMDNLYFYR